MNAIIEASGLGDSAVYMQASAGLAKAYSDYGKGAGNFPKVDNIMVDRVLANTWIINYLDAKVFADGLGVSSVMAEDQRAGAVRVPLMAPPPYNPRTRAYQPGSGQSVAGTDGNDGLENINLPNVAQTDGVEVWFNQTYDQSTVFLKVSQNMLSLDIMGNYTKQIPQAVANMTDCSIMAQQLNHGLYRAFTKDDSNLVKVDLNKSSTQGYLQQMMNSLVSVLTNPQTDWSEGVVQYPLENAVIVMKHKLWNQFFTIGNGAIVNSNIGSMQLVNGRFTAGGTADGRPMGSNIRGEYSSVLIKVVPDSYFRNAARYLGVENEAQLAEYDKILGYICHSDGTAFGRLDTTINPIPNPGNNVGTKVQNQWDWGVNVVRSSSIGIMVDETDDPFDNPITTLKQIIAPRIWGATYGGTQSVKVSEG